MLLSVYKEDDRWGLSPDIYPLSRENMGLLFAGKPKEWLVTLFRESASPKTLETVQQWAQEAGLSDITELIASVRKAYARSFVVFFPYGQEASNQAAVVRYIDSRQQIRYHVDYTLVNGETGALLNLHLDEDGEWFTPSDMGNPLLIAPIGQEIAKKERLQAVIEESEVVTPLPVDFPPIPS